VRRVRTPRARGAVLLAAGLAAGLGGRVARSADDLAVEVTVDRPRPAADDVVRLTYRFSGSGLGTRDPFREVVV